VAGGVFVLHLAVEHVGDRLEPAVRVVRRTDGLARGVRDRAHLVEDQEGVRMEERLGGGKDDAR
jgi:hypothetical protein